MTQPIESIDTPAQRYSAALDSVNLISARIAAPYGDQTEEERKKEIERNAEHLKIAVAWDIWTDEDLAPLHQAIADASLFTT